MGLSRVLGAFIICFCSTVTTTHYPVLLTMRSVKALNTKVEDKGKSPPHYLCLRPYLPVPDIHCLRHRSFILTYRVTCHSGRTIFPVCRRGSTADISIRSIISYNFNSCNFLRSIKINFTRGC